jgi:hypothetical protein
VREKTVEELKEIWDDKYQAWVNSKRDGKSVRKIVFAHQEALTARVNLVVKLAELGELEPNIPTPSARLFGEQVK